MGQQPHSRSLESFPLAGRLLEFLSIPPCFNYLQTNNARFLSAKLQSWPDSYTPGEISAIGLLGKIYLALINRFRLKHSPTLFEDLGRALSAPTYIDSLVLFLDNYPLDQSPPIKSASSSFRLSEFLRNNDGVEFLLKNVLLGVLANTNPVIKRTDGVFSDSSFSQSALFYELAASLNSFFHLQKGEGDTFAELSLLELLKKPFLAHPDSIYEQLNYIYANWSHLLDQDFIKEILKSLDRIKEEQIKLSFDPGNVQNPILEARASYLEDLGSVRFSDDLDWMPRLILIAKNIFVWLDQLSKHYQKSIHALDQIPDIELEKLSSWGITGLWLIGIWERSKASQKIKQACGNRDAVPSAYSLYDYTIADVLGGEQAYKNLSDRASNHGIRLAADMVPNHMGIYSKWIVEHPEWFISLDNSPFPNYTYNGENLSEDNRLGIYLEDHYYDRSDAAVVFKHVDHHAGSTKFIYHGNDGTSMPWNDTAQLNFLRSDVRDAVIDAILHVANKFSVIRFDAAMTLTKKHFQRLWFPEPGTGGAIPTRSDAGMSKAKFDEFMPVEFWREVVDRVAEKAPDTLLLAEAFWMMEGYFVRTLGMHRVYNSAFMHMLRDEKNASFRKLILETLAFDPQILKRYVNFMNNPDEDTAVSQFGSDGKYFGTCVMMVTLPGLPMFGHGQIEGFKEKYGMEYKRAYYDESPDDDLIKRHQREIFPLLHKRHLFADVENFVLYDCVDSSGNLNENVFAFSNRYESETALIIYHNKWDSIHGVISHSAAVNGDNFPLHVGLDLDTTKQFVLFRDMISNLEFVRPVKEFISKGLDVKMGAYHYHVFIDFHSVNDPDNHYAKLCSFLQGRGTPSLVQLIEEHKLHPLLKISNDIFELLFANILVITPRSTLSQVKLSEIRELLSSFFNEVLLLHPDLFFNMPSAIKCAENLITTNYSVHREFSKQLSIDNEVVFSLLFWILFKDIFGSLSESERKIILSSITKQVHSSNQLPDNFQIRSKNLSLLLLNISSELSSINLSPPELSKFWFSNPYTREYLKTNQYNGISWFDRDSFRFLLQVTLLYVALTTGIIEFKTGRDNVNLLSKVFDLFRYFIRLLEKSDYQEDKLFQLIKDTPFLPG